MVAVAVREDKDHFSKKKLFPKAKK